MQKCMVAMINGMGWNAAQRTFGKPKPTILRHKLNRNKIAKGGVVYRGRATVLSDEVEVELVNHSKTLDEMMFGITRRDLMYFAYQDAMIRVVSLEKN